MVGKKSLISGKSYTFFLISNYELSMKWAIFAYDDEGLVPAIPGGARRELIRYSVVLIKKRVCQNFDIPSIHIGKK